MSLFALIAVTVVASWVNIRPIVYCFLWCVLSSFPSYTNRRTIITGSQHTIILYYQHNREKVSDIHVIQIQSPNVYELLAFLNYL